jgi:hypothetical protein
VSPGERSQHPVGARCYNLRSGELRERERENYCRFSRVHGGKVPRLETPTCEGASCKRS